MTHISASESRDAYCARFHHAIELIGRRWTGAILLALRCGRTRYSDIRDAVPGLSDHLLCDRLRQLEAAALVQREVAPTTPVQVRYRLTPMGEGLGPVLDAVSKWANQWLEADPEAAPGPLPAGPPRSTGRSPPPNQGGPSPSGAPR